MKRIRLLAVVAFTLLQWNPAYSFNLDKPFDIVLDGKDGENGQNGEQGEDGGFGLLTGGNGGNGGNG